MQSELNHYFAEVTARSQVFICCRDLFKAKHAIDNGLDTVRNKELGHCLEVFQGTDANALNVRIDQLQPGQVELLTPSSEQTDLRELAAGAGNGSSLI